MCNARPKFRNARQETSDGGRFAYIIIVRGRDRYRLVRDAYAFHSSIPPLGRTLYGVVAQKRITVGLLGRNYLVKTVSCLRYSGGPPAQLARPRGSYSGKCNFSFISYRSTRRHLTVYTGHAVSEIELPPPTPVLFCWSVVRANIEKRRNFGSFVFVRITRVRRVDHGDV